MPLTYASCICQFQSTLPLRGATRLQKQSGMTIKISIHTPLAGSDRPWRAIRPFRDNFNPHSPCGERLHECRDLRSRTLISIHTPLAGSDLSCPATCRRCYNFNPHSPCGERPLTWFDKCRMMYFNPHSPCGERLRTIDDTLEKHLFQSTLPLRGATSSRKITPDIHKFQSTLPLRGATHECRDLRC